MYNLDSTSEVFRHFYKEYYEKIDDLIDDIDTESIVMLVEDYLNAICDKYEEGERLDYLVILSTDINNLRKLIVKQ